MPLIINHIVLFLFHWWRNQNPSCLHTTYIYLHNNIKARPTAASHSIVPPHNPTTVTLYFNVSRGINNQARTLTIVTLFYKAVTYYPNIARSRWIYVHCIDSCLNFVLCTSYLLFCRWDIAYHVSTWKEWDGCLSALTASHQIDECKDVLERILKAVRETGTIVIAPNNARHVQNVTAMPAWSSSIWWKWFKFRLPL